MAFPVYSTCFFSATTSSGDAIYAVPAGYVAILRDLTVYNNSAILAEVFLEDSDNGLTLVRFDNVVNVDGTPGESSHQWTGRQVFHAGGGFFCRAAEGDWDCRASGYLLSAP